MMSDYIDTGWCSQSNGSTDLYKRLTMNSSLLANQSQRSSSYLHFTKPSKGVDAGRASSFLILFGAILLLYSLQLLSWLLQVNSSRSNTNLKQRNQHLKYQIK